MNTKIVKKWLIAARPHTMGLSFAVILAGACQVGWNALRLDILFLSLCAAGGFQAVSNFANDYGDFKKGTDAHRTELYRSLSGGNFSAEQVRKAIIYLSIFSILCVVLLVYLAPIPTSGRWAMFGLGIASVLAAVGYTMGKRPYGYYALGDVMVFLFFGLVGVVGSYYMQSAAVANWSVWMLALAFGAFSTTVLNINNIRDCEKDKNHSKTTIANLLGLASALLYQRGLFVVATIGFVVYATITQGFGLIPLVFANLFAWAIYQRLTKATEHAEYNQCLAMTVKFTLLLSLPTAAVGLIYF